MEPGDTTAAARVACVDVPALPLQLLLRAHPDWRERPVVVVADDRPQGIVEWTNARARRLRILPGMTFAAARSLAAHLHAAAVPREHVEAATEALLERLQRFSPRIEPSAEPGVFWVDPSGLVPLYGSLETWAAGICADFQRQGFDAAVMVGFHRYRSYALTRARTLAAAAVHEPARAKRTKAREPRPRSRAWVVLPDPLIERRLADRVPLACLGVAPSLRDRLRVLGIDTLGEFLHLPACELPTRLGDEAARLHAEASDRPATLVPRPLVLPITATLQFEPPEADHTRLLFAIKGELWRALVRLAARGQALTAVRLRLALDHAPDHHERVEPARPTLETPLVLDLLRLRLGSLSLPAAIETLVIELEGTAATHEQLALFRVQKRRDLEAAGRTLARLRASFGACAVTRAVLRSAHLPEASHGWEPTTELRAPATPPTEERPPLCRRVFSRAQVLPVEGSLPSCWRGDAVIRLHGPHRISGGWWVRTVERDYYYAELQHGGILWIFYDRPRRRWFLHGIVD